MKILITFYELQDPGGIINNQEALYCGLRELGHDVDVRLLVWKSSIQINKGKRALAQQTSAMGMKYDQDVGWSWPAHMRVPYKGKYNIQRWKTFANKYDLIIWQIPCPTMRKENKGNVDWVELYDVPVKQVVYIHDANMVDAYPWIYRVLPHLTAAAGVNGAAYNTLKNLPLPRALAVSGMQNIAERIKSADQSLWRDGWASFHTFKAWKRMGELVRAVPYMSQDYRKIVGGGGIQYYYMTSKTKVKPEYLTSTGERIWDIALRFGMDYRGYVSNEEREQLSHTVKFMIDPSWSKLIRKWGDHYNRVPIEGAIAGTVPIARNWGIAQGDDGVGEFFIPNKHYVLVPHNATPQEFAHIVDNAITMPEAQRLEMVDNIRRDIVPHYDNRAVAQTFIDLAEGRPAGVWKRENDVGTFNEKMKREGERHFEEWCLTPLGAAA